MSLCCVWHVRAGCAAAVPSAPGPLHPPSRPRLPPAALLSASHPRSSAAWCREAPQNRKEIQCNVVATKTAMIQRRDKLILVSSRTLKAGQATGSGWAAKCGQKKRPCTCPWDDERIQERTATTHSNYFIWVFSFCRAYSCYTLSLDNSQTWTFSGHWSHVGCCANPLPQDDSHGLPPPPAFLLLSP